MCVKYKNVRWSCREKVSMENLALRSQLVIDMFLPSQTVVATGFFFFFIYKLSCRYLLLLCFPLIL